MFARILERLTGTEEIKSAIHRPAANTSAVVTLAAVNNRRHNIHQIEWSYSADPTGGKLTVTDAGVVIFEVDITKGGPGGFNLVLPGAVNSEVVITLAAGGVGITGKLNVQYIEAAL